jgi:hypothetical protein
MVTDTSRFVNESFGDVTETEAAAVETSEAPEGEAKTEPDTEPEETETQEQERDEQGRFKSKEKSEDEDAELPKGVRRRIQKEIDKAVAARKEAERYAQELRAKAEQGADPAKKTEPATSSNRPKLDDFESYDEYVDKLTDWKIEQREAARQKQEAELHQKAAQQTRAESWNEKVEAARDKYEDFDDVIESITTPITPAMQEAIMESGIGTDIAYHLAQHPKEIQRIAKLSPMQAAIEIGKLEAKLTAPVEKKKPAVSKAPEPIKPVGAKASTAKKSLYEIDDFTEYVKRRRAGER